jgi:hypothetical protein
VWSFSITLLVTDTPLRVHEQPANCSGEKNAGKQQQD